MIQFTAETKCSGINLSDGAERIVAGSFRYSLPGGVFRYHSRAGRPLLFFPSGCLKNSPMFRSAASPAAPLLKKNVEFPEEQHS